MWCDFLKIEWLYLSYYIWYICIYIYTHTHIAEYCWILLNLFCLPPNIGDFWSKFIISELFILDKAMLFWVIKTKTNKKNDEHKTFFIIILLLFYFVENNDVNTESHRSEYTPHIFVNILLYLVMWQHWRNDTLLQCKVVSLYNSVNLLPSQNNSTHSL